MLNQRQRRGVFRVRCPLCNVSEWIATVKSGETDLFHAGESASDFLRFRDADPVTGRLLHFKLQPAEEMTEQSNAVASGRWVHGQATPRRLQIPSSVPKNFDNLTTLGLQPNRGGVNPAAATDALARRPPVVAKPIHKS
ncbi:unnamed protein product [Amoebophrya sp. A25]|nr:unnamed protein product [Amoebophrya sp. A25]|eukprot:GSA25T00023571001.1